MRRSLLLCVPFWVLLPILLGAIAWGQIPRTISYQGVLTDGTGAVVPDGNYDLTFRLYDVATGGTALWSEGQLVAVSKGIFNVILGSVSSLTLPFDKPYWLGVTVAGGVELTPRIPLTSAAYSLRSATADGFSGSGTISAQKLEGGGTTDQPVGVYGAHDASYGWLGGTLRQATFPLPTFIAIGMCGYGETQSTLLSGAQGVRGEAKAIGSGAAVGGYFLTSSEGEGVHRGVYAAGYGASSGSTYGVYGYGDNSSSGDVYGGYFAVSAQGTGTHYGVYAREAAGGTGAAVYAAGDLVASGNKSAVLKTSHGHRLMSVIESPEVWFEDFGEGQLVNGRAHVELDPLFLETVTINAEHPMKVFIQLKDDCRGTYVKTSTTGFDVFELQGGTSNASFSYRVVAKRKGYETQRLEETTVGKEDFTLYPELRGEIERRSEEEARCWQPDKQRQNGGVR